MRLSIEELSSGYDGGTVVDKLSLAVEDGEVVALLGRNGVGKSTLIMTIMGFVEPMDGRIIVGSTDIERWSPARIARSGVGLVPQGRRVFAPLTVEENLSLATRNVLAGPWNLPRIYELFPRLGERRRQRSGSLSGGEQQMLALARALIRNPGILLLDEPSEGLAPIMIDSLIDALKVVLSEGQTVLLVEQDISLALDVADRIAVMARGHVAWDTTREEFEASPEMVEKLMGASQ